MELKRSERPHFDLDLVSGPEAMRQFSELLDRSFRVPKGQRFLEDFPVWDERYAPQGPGCARMGAFAPGGKLVASAAVRLAPLKAPRRAIPIALIGAVATDEAHRGFGLASRLVRLAVDWAQDRGAAAVLLWGSEHALYRRQGFELRGEQVRVPLSALRLPERRLGEVTEGWSPAIFDRMLSRPGGLALGPEDRRWIEAHRRVRWFTIGSPSDIRAYAAIGRGIDLPGVVHEWGGETEALLGLLAALRGLVPDASLLGPADLLRDRGLLPEGSVAEPLCLARILDPATVRLSFGLSGSDNGRAHFPLGFWIWGLDAA